jgi:hypothetical protein
MDTQEADHESDIPSAPFAAGETPTHVQYNRRFAPGFPLIVSELNKHIQERVKGDFHLSDTVSHAVGYYMLCHSYQDLAIQLPAEMKLSKELGAKKKVALMKEIAAMPKARRPKAEEIKAILRKQRYDIRAYSIHHVIDELIDETLRGTPYDRLYDKCIIQVGVKHTLRDVIVWSPEKADTLAEFMSLTFQHHHKKGYIFDF